MHRNLSNNIIFKCLIPSPTKLLVSWFLKCEKNVENFDFLCLILRGPCDVPQKYHDMFKAKDMPVINTSTIDEMPISFDVKYTFKTSN
jgi:hypothetical protein